MPQPPFANFPGEVVEHHVVDSGETLQVTSYSKLMEQLANGQLAVVSRSESFRTVDGVVYSSLYATRQDPILLAVCHTCRNPEVGLLFHREKATHGLCTLSNARECHSCGITVCPLHRETRQNRAFCQRCARRQRLWRMIRPLFFRRVGE